MGYDIHLFVEYDVSERPGAWNELFPAICSPVTPFSQVRYIKAYAQGEILIPRDYKVFAALAGVRRPADHLGPLHEARGFPAEADPDVLCSFYHYVLDEGEPLYNPAREVTRESAESWVQSGKSHYRDHEQKANGLVSSPDWHTPSWLLASELRSALAYHGIEALQSSLELHVLQLLLDELEQRCGAGRSRVVFWFDS